MSLPPVLQRCADLGFRIFTRGAFNLNLIGVRTAGGVNEFNDWMTCSYKDETEKWISKRWKATTDPGKYWLKFPSRVEGCAILCPGIHQSIWKLGLHRKSYEALVQRVSGRPVRVFRDANLDDVLDIFVGQKTMTGFYGINCHRASSRKDGKPGSDESGSQIVDRYSAGCQVLSDADDFSELINLCHKQVKAGHGETFSYTLLEDW